MRFSHNFYSFSLVSPCLSRKKDGTCDTLFFKKFLQVSALVELIISNQNPGKMFSNNSESSYTEDSINAAFLNLSILPR